MFNCWRKRWHMVAYPFQAPVSSSDVTYNYSIDLYHMLEMIDILQLYYDNVSAYNIAPPNGVSALGPSLRIPERTSLYRVFLSTKIFYRSVAGFVTGCPCGVWSHGLNACQCISVHFCFDWMEHSLFLFWKIISICWYKLPPKFLFKLYFQPSNMF